MESNNNLQLRDVLRRAVDQLESFIGCDMHDLHPEGTSCDGMTTMGECKHKKTCQIIFDARRELAKPPRRCDMFNSGDPDKDAEDALKAMGPMDAELLAVEDDFIVALAWLLHKVKPMKESEVADGK